MCVCVCVCVCVAALCGSCLGGAINVMITGRVGGVERMVKSVLHA